VYFRWLFAGHVPFSGKPNVCHSPPVIKHDQTWPSRPTSWFIDDFHIEKSSFCSGIFQLATFDYQTDPEGIFIISHSYPTNISIMLHYYPIHIPWISINIRLICTFSIFIPLTTYVTYLYPSPLLNSPVLRQRVGSCEASRSGAQQQIVAAMGRGTWVDAGCNLWSGEVSFFFFLMLYLHTVMCILL
jgi:hypothetical protein